MELLCLASKLAQWPLVVLQCKISPATKRAFSPKAVIVKETCKTVDRSPRTADELNYDSFNPRRFCICKTSKELRKFIVKSVTSTLTLEVNSEAREHAGWVTLIGFRGGIRPRFSARYRSEPELVLTEPDRRPTVISKTLTYPTVSPTYISRSATYNNR